MLVYLDNSATTRQYDEVTDLMAEMARENYGNTSSLHRMGIKAEQAVKEARQKTAKSINAKPEEITFTACGTESDNTVLFGTAKAKRREGKRIITTEVEHPAILEPCKALEQEGFEIVRIGVDKKCRLDMDALKAAVNDDTILISVMAVNNESGIVMPIKEIADFKDAYNKAHGTNMWFHTDAVQALGKVELDVKGALKNVDFISASAHKIHGPKGTGFLYMKQGTNLRPFMLGGGQEKGFRSGTLDNNSIVGFGKACELAAANRDILVARAKHMGEVRARLLDGLKAEVPDILINSVEELSKLPGLEGAAGYGDSVCNYGCPSVLNVSFLGTRGEVILHTLEQDGIFVSTGSACSSNHASSKGSHVLNAMGLKFKEIEGAIRFSFNEFNTVEEMDYVVDCVKKAVTRFRKLGAFR